MALTDEQRFQIRFYLGWSERFHDYDSRLEQAMNALATRPDAEQKITDTLANGGILASLDDIDTKLTDAHKRLKALKVGSIGLSGWGEISGLRKEGKRHTRRLASILGVERRTDVFGSGGVRTFAGFEYKGASNYVGK